MSLILDALRRAESERSATTPQGHGSRQGHDVRMRRPLPTTTLVLINLTVFLAGAALAMWLLRSVLGLEPATTPAAAAPQPAPLREPAVTPTPATAPVVHAVTPPTAAAPAPAVSTPAAAPAIEREMDSAPVAEVADAAQPGPDTHVDPDAYASLDDIAPLYASPYDASSDWQPEAAAPAAPAGVPQRAPAPTLDPAAFAAALAQQPAAGAQDAAPIHSEPQLRDMPAAYRAQFPSLTIQVHVYDDDPQRRWVLIDGRRYGEGSTLAAGPELVSIEADGMVLAFRGENIWWPLQR